MPETRNYSLNIGNQVLKIEIGKLARQANGAVTARLGDTVVLAAATMSKNQKVGADYMPLVVDYEEKFYARGKILGSRFIRREGRPSEEAILNARLIDRAIRPLFDQSIRNEIQIVSTVLSVDEKNDPDIVAMIAASIALSISDIPWDGPIAAIRIGRTDSKWVLNPSFEERTAGIADLVISVSPDLKINMIEAGGSEIKEEDLISGFEFARESLKDIVEFVKKISDDFDTPKASVSLAATDKEIEEEVRKFLNKNNVLENAVYEKKKAKRLMNLDALKEELIAHITTIDVSMIKAAEAVFEALVDEMVHKNILERDLRPDGRSLDELRPLSAEIGFLPRTHGSGLFERGETQVLSALTLGAPSDEQIVEGMVIQTKKHFMHQYNFPPYSVGETGRMGSPGRREIGHGALAEKALEPMIPKKEEFPYAIRVVSEVLSSNGSSSMASTCASTLALMDGGVPIKKPVAGIAMGMISDGKNVYKILTDIQGPEDHYGDMDFKVAGTRDGVTALQMDVKINGVDVATLEKALAQAKKARLQILDHMAKTIAEPKKELSPLAPRIITIQIHVDKIREVIGPGGKVINDIIAKTGAAIDIEDSGLIFITAENEKSGLEAKAIIEEIVKEYKVGDIITGKVTQIMDFGAIVEFGRGKDGMIHISELAPRRVEKVTDIVNVGDEVKVKIKRIENGKTSLSLKDAAGK
ncbi:polyribonucleotide nucleotidyltransferase [Candidatus Azambacteria bacterium RIFOXYD1_FULL_42_11]|uniref:Polyribonucleotide nucleotidyltransferase n=4 Tax=Candidatus Azamiibacteriota TaxID=1752741 RepID=A0A0G0ZBX8_9BACT|nr:MAG: Polyribonucleotide nucleotidyltransferase [Candidatus Azambacteria bacterium GW2011_GWB1_42_17]KKS46149.1 MAG: Polyribonucleotide nucleotidyltransferase [Candidatus Azambacteria bacterium GW2011_GWA1_42_19]KKS75734.1 MAG: Polyribonucleotide nucleotidyltransferase [Candidatus Azambacteria bacterium GW2011_GWA2_42_9]KKS88493.1 MAG: Polyribonucleotide nucleotidyltransferase [Parcubacteria group bacterium GW2011_GWC1_43_11]OGD42027.1 MAG: polyribonucleotide nucleotidyltransferase [Candidatu